MSQGYSQRYKEQCKESRSVVGKIRRRHVNTPFPQLGFEQLADRLYTGSAAKS
jgi:hypothetical protein